MVSGSSEFFPKRDEREVLDWVINDFPFPVAINYARLQDELDKQSPIAAAWKLRDTFESLIEFITCVAIADFLQANPDPEDVSSIVGLLFKYNGLSLGDWVSLLVGQSDEKDKGALRQIETFARSEALDKSGRMFPELFNLFFKLKGKKGTEKSEINRRLKGDKQGFVEWRNRVFGHGTFKSNYGFYAEETNRWILFLHEFLKALRPVFENWSLVSIGPDGSRNIWQGVNNVPGVESHTHEPEGEPMLMQFAHRFSARSLPFGVLMSLQQCTHCKQPTAFFFNRNSRERRKNRNTTYFLEYFGGHEESHQNLLETQKLAAKLPPHFNWQRTSYDSQEIRENLALLFRDFDKELVRPDYLVDNFWRIVDEQSKGYVHLVGESGMGKTFFIRALESEGKERGKPVLAYHILSGALSDYRTFISELSDRARETLRFRTQEAQTNVAAVTDLQEQFAGYLSGLMSANGLDRLIVAIDALDELPEPESGAAAITSLLPMPENLPDGCFVLLTSREVLRPGVRQDLEQLERRDAPAKTQGQSERFTKIRIRPEDAENQRLLRGYLQEHLPPQFRSRENIETLLQRSGSVFLYVFHFCRALESGAFADIQTLPAGRDFYPAYLANLREATGLLYDTVYLKALLLLAAAQAPVTLNQLVSWGVPKNYLPYDIPVALISIKDFLRLHRVRLWHDSLSEEEGDNRYAIAHEAFIRFLREDEVMAERLRAAHVDIARRALAAHQGKWEELYAEDDGQLYDLRFVLTHLREAKLAAEETALRNDEEYASQCWMVGNSAGEKAKYLIAADLFDNAVSIYRYLIANGRKELESDLARVLLNKGNAFGNLGRLEESISLFDEAIGIYRRLINAGHSELAKDLAMMLASKAGALSDIGALEQAIGFLDEAGGIYRYLINAGHSDSANDLAAVLITKGNSVAALGRLEESLGIYDEAIAIRQRLVDAGRGELAGELALALMSKGNVFLHLGNPDQAVGIYDRSIGIYQELINAGRGELANELARVLMNKGNALANLGKQEEALGVYDKAIAIRQQLVDAGRSELAGSLALALMNQGLAIAELGKYAEALGNYDRAIGIYRRLISTGRSDLNHELARALLNKANTILNLNTPAEAIGIYDEAIGIYRQLVNAGRGELANDLATMLMNKATALDVLGRPTEAINIYDEAINIYQPLVDAGRSELAAALALTLINKGITLAQLKDWQSSLTCYNDGIKWQIFCVDGGMSYLLPQLLEYMRLRRELFLMFKLWDAAAQDVLEVCRRITPFLQAGSLPAPIAQAVGAMRNRVNALAIDEQQQIYGRLGEWAAILRNL